jgi:spermidine synthase
VGVEKLQAEDRGTPAASGRAPLAVIITLFLMSGGTALLYQVAFGKKLSTIFGATAYAVSAVLAAFMGGLALGSHLGGRHAGRVRRPLVVYGVAEIVVAVVCALTPELFDGVAAAYLAAVEAMPTSLAAVSVVRALITSLVVLTPTIAMGVTLPLLAKQVAGPGEKGARQRLATLYAINTAGGAIGAIASAYLVLPALGVYATMRTAALVNLTIGVVAIAIGRRSPALPAEAVEGGDDKSTEAAPLGMYALLAIASGVLVFATEVVDTHLLALLIGNSAYAFGLMLAVFLTCLSLGASLAQPVDRRLGRSALPVMLVLTGIALLVTLPLWGQIPLIFLGVGEDMTSWYARESVRAGCAVLVLALPTTFMGLTFPLLLRRVARRSDVAKQVGRLTAVNTVGSIVGSLVSGYLILPALGSERMLKAIALTFVACGVMAAAWDPSARKWQRPDQASLVGAALAVACALLIPNWDMKVMTSGANVYFSSREPVDELVYVAEDVHGGLTSVARRGRVLTLYTNGKFQGDNSYEIVAQRSFAHFPGMFLEGYERALVIGLGTGTTLGSVSAYPFEKIDAVEISPSIAHAARVYFADANRGALDDPRVTLTMNDGRNMLLTSPKRYDLITIEVSSVWFAGAANIYSAEFYALVRSRLQDSGVLQQWVQLHHIDKRELASALHTIRSGFEHVALFISGGQGIVVAANRPLVASRQRLEELNQRPEIQQTLAINGSMQDLLGRLVLSGAELDRFIAESTAQDGGPILSTDQNLYLEYATPKGNVMRYHDSIQGMFKLLMSYRDPDSVARHLVP